MGRYVPDIQKFAVLKEICEYTTIRNDTFPVRVYLKDRVLHVRAIGNSMNYLYNHHNGTPCNLALSSGKVMRNVKIKLGRYLNNAMGCSTFVCFDFDDHKLDFNYQAYSKLTKLFKDNNIQPIIFPSDTGNGCHVYVLFNKPIDVDVLVKTAGRICTAKSVDTFPKGTMCYGGNIWYPYHWSLDRQKKIAIQTSLSALDYIPTYDFEKFASLASIEDVVDAPFASSKFQRKGERVGDSLYHKLKEVCSKVDPRWIYESALVQYKDEILWLDARDSRSPTGDRNPSVRVWNGRDSLTRIRGTSYFWRDNTAFLPWEYLMAFRGFTQKQAIDFLFGKARCLFNPSPQS